MGTWGQAGAERPFVGRESDLDRLRSLLAAARGGEPHVVVVDGPPGIGKSTLLDQLRRSVGSQQLADIVSVTAEPAEAGLAFGVLSGVLAGLDPAAPFAAVPAGADAFAVGLTLLTRLGGAGPARLLVVDDVQWADAASLRSLLFALRRLRGERLLAVLSVRTGDAVPDDLARLQAHPATVHLPLSGLDIASTAALCGELAGRVLAPSTVARLHEATGGNPLWLTAAAAMGDRLGRHEPGERLPPPPQYAELVRRQLAACSADVSALAVAVAVTGPVSLREVAGAYEAAGGSTDPALWPDAVVRDAVAARLVGAVDGGLRPYHALSASAVYWSLPAGRRAQLHRVAAAGAADPDRRLDHRCAADAVLGDDADLRADLEARAALMRRSGSSARAAALTLAAADRAEGDDPARLRTQAGLDLLRAGDLDRADQIAALAHSAADSAAGLALRGSLALLRGRPAEAATLLRRGYAEAGSDPALAGICAAQITALVINLGLGEETLHWARRSAALTPSDGMAQLMLYAAEGVLVDGPDYPWPQADEPAAALAGTLAGRGVQWLWRGDESAARRFLQEGLEVALRDGPIIVGVIAGYYLAEASYRLGDHRGALAASDANLSLAHDADMTWTWSLAHATRVAPLVALGRLEEASEHTAIARDSSSGDFAAILWIAVAGARVALAAGDPAGALVALAAMEPYAGVAGAGNPAVQPWRLLQARALLEVGREDEAEALLRPVEESLARWPRPWTALQAARIRAELARRRGDPAGAEGVLKAAVTEGGRHPSWEAALLRADYGALLRRRNRRSAAAAQLETAYRRLESMGVDTASVATEIAALDGRPAQGLLTGRERAVTGLVAQGATNREIAQALHLSVKTVEYHLGHAFAKLQVRSRGGVAAALSRHDAAAP